VTPHVLSDVLVDAVTDTTRCGGVHRFEQRLRVAVGVRLLIHHRLIIDRLGVGHEIDARGGSPGACGACTHSMRARARTGGSPGRMTIFVSLTSMGLSGLVTDPPQRSCRQAWS